MSNPTVTITLQNGQVMTGELYPDKAPNTVNNFIALSNSGFYDGLTFHRCIPGFMIQGRLPQRQRDGRPRVRHPGEFKANGFANNDILHTTGVLTMARGHASRTAPAASFFIMVDAAPHLDGQYAAFGKITGNVEGRHRRQRSPHGHAGQATGRRW